MNMRCFVATALALTGAAYAAPVVSDSDRFTFLNMPTPLGLPCDLAVGPDNNVYTNYLLANKIVQINPTTNAIKEFDIPFTLPLLSNLSLPVYGGVAFAPCVVRPGQDGAMYAATGLRNQLAKLNLTTGEVSVFTPPNALQPVGNLQLLNDMWGGPEDMFLSQSTADVISAFNYKTHQWRTYQVPTIGSNPFGMRYASDDHLWFTETIGQKIGRLNPTTGVIQEFPIPFPTVATPAVLRVEADNKLWFTCFVSDSVAGIDMTTHNFTNYKNTAFLSEVSVPSVNTLDGQGNIWFSTWTQNLLTYFPPATGKMTHIEIPRTLIYTPISVPFEMNVGVQYYGGEGKNRIYFTQSIFNRVGYYDLDAGQ